MLGKALGMWYKKKRWGLMKDWTNFTNLSSLPLAVPKGA